MKSKVTDRGQITIPMQLRRRMGILPGQLLEFREEEGHIAVLKVLDEDPVGAVYGILPNDGRTTDEIVERLRGPVDKV